MNDVIADALDQPFVTAAGRDVWEACADKLVPALARDARAPFLEALEEVARNAALTGSSEVGALVGGLREGLLMVRRALAAGHVPQVAATIERLDALERDGVARIADGYAAGLQETIGRLQRQTEESSSVDPASGAMRVTETLERLGLEVDRCRRMALSLGVLGIAFEGGACDTDACRRAEGPDLLHVVAGALHGHVRRYDGVGRTADGDFLVVLPDVTRRTLAAIAERLRREVFAELGHDVPCVVALAHYDYVDVGAAEMMAAIEHGVAAARTVDRPLTWV